MIRLAERAHRVGRAGAAAGEHHARLPGDTCVAVRHASERVLVASADESDAPCVRGLPEGVVEVQRMDGDDAEDGVDVLGDERLDDGASGGHLRHAGNLLGGGPIIAGQPAPLGAFETGRCVAFLNPTCATGGACIGESYSVKRYNRVELIRRRR